MINEALENKLGIVDIKELNKKEEILSKKRAYELFDLNLLDKVEAGTYKGLSYIHKYLFQDLYFFAGKIRNINISKGSFVFANFMFLEKTLNEISLMNQSSFDEIIKKYVEMNIAHPFLEGNGRAMRIWLDLIFKKELSTIINWDKIDKNEYLKAMQISPYNQDLIKNIIKAALSSKINDKEIYVKGIDASFYFEGFNNYKYKDLISNIKK